MELFVFVCAAAMALVGALGVVLRGNPVHAALSLVLTLFGVAVLFVQQGAHFLAAVQVIVYAGAIVVLFLFVIMLLGVDRAENLSIEPLASQRLLAGVMGTVMVGLLTAAVVTSDSAVIRSGGGLDPATVATPDANIKQVASSIFGENVFAFEITSVLLVVAVVGTVVLARRLPSREEASS
ncbi:MAG: NADH-quinone oxidoreductase subunit J [Ilumatobacteraceae bacterium]